MSGNLNHLHNFHNCFAWHLVLVVILLHEKFLQFDWLRAVAFQLNLKYLHVKLQAFCGQ